MDKYKVYALNSMDSLGQMPFWELLAAIVSYANRTSLGNTMTIPTKAEVKRTMEFFIRVVGERLSEEDGMDENGNYQMLVKYPVVPKNWLEKLKMKLGRMPKTAEYVDDMTELDFIHRLNEAAYSITLNLFTEGRKMYEEGDIDRVLSYDEKKSLLDNALDTIEGNGFLRDIAMLLHAAIYAMEAYKSLGMPMMPIPESGPGVIEDEISRLIKESNNQDDGDGIDTPFSRQAFRETIRRYINDSGIFGIQWLFIGDESVGIKEYLSGFEIIEEPSMTGRDDLHRFMVNFLSTTNAYVVWTFYLLNLFTQDIISKRLSS